VTEFKADCLDPLGVPTIKPYPDECSGNCTPPTGLCPTTVRLDADGDAVDLDPGWTGQAHDAHVPLMTRLTLGLSGCAGTDHPSCGVCSLWGPIANAGGTEFNNQRCVSDTSIECTSNADCLGPPDTGPCHFFLGPPVPLSVGGVSVCITAEIAAPATGTFNIEANTWEAQLRLTARAYVGPVQDKPCPNCIAGICDSGVRGNGACTVNGRSPLFGEVSFDCPPEPGADAGILPIFLDLTTGVRTWSLSAASPDCRAPGYTGGKCFCDTCATAEAEPCAKNTDCPGGAICGGLRCIGGSNGGGPCVVAGSGSECPGGACGRTGKATAWNECDDTVCTPNTPPDDDSTNEGVCASGPNELFCAIETFRGCFTDGDCTKPGDSCTLSKFRECFTDNGVIGTRCFGGTNDPATETCTDLTDCSDQSVGTFCGGGSVSVSGAAGTACGLTSDPVVAALFCIPPTTNSSVNNPGGLPGLGRATIPTRARFDQ
jgi:hypothetical protein